MIEVAVGVVANDAGEVLVTRRRDDAHQGGLWEFPGGKRELNETIREALDRELREELGIEVIASQPLMVIEHDYGDKRVRLDVHRVTRYSGVPNPREEQPMRWVPIAELPELEFPVANVSIVQRLSDVQGRIL